MTCILREHNDGNVINVNLTLYPLYSLYLVQSLWNIDRSCVIRRSMNAAASADDVTTFGGKLARKKCTKYIRIRIIILPG